MPLYEYQCSKCGKVFEVMQKFSDAPLTVHDGCGGEVVKLLSAPAFHLKGSGWYATDYARTPAKSDSSKSDSEKKDTAKTDTAKTETKTETKPETKSETKSDTKSDSKPAPSGAGT
jgi:putative FmdB family regulatory protein